MPGTQLDDCLSVRQGSLFVEGVSAGSLASSFGTPLFVVSEDQLRRNVLTIRRAFEGRWPGAFGLLPSIKANPCLALRLVLNDAGTGCDVFGPGELEAALATGLDGSLISLNGPMKDTALLRRAISEGVRITLDSVAEFHAAHDVAKSLDRVAHIRFRLRPDLEPRTDASEMAPDGTSIRDAVLRYKAGIPTEDLLAIPPETIGRPHLDAAGVMFHLGRHSADPEMWGAGIDGALKILGGLRERWPGWSPREVDVGGGFPAPRDPFGRRLPQRADAPDTAPSFSEYAEVVCSRLITGLGGIGIEASEVLLEVEPGRSLYANAGIHLATVRNLKRQSDPAPLRWVETDTSDAYLPDVNLEYNRWTCLVAGRAEAAPEIVADVTGRTCALDVLVEDAELPQVEVGEVLAFLDTGAYQDASASNFNALPRPGTVLVRGEKADVIRRPESQWDVFARDLVPRRLRELG